jgi:hypothetical protein
MTERFSVPAILDEEKVVVVLNKTFRIFHQFPSILQSKQQQLLLLLFE